MNPIVLSLALCCAVPLARAGAQELVAIKAGRVVTVSGSVRSQAERQRALQLAKETNGVREVVDRLVLK